MSLDFGDFAHHYKQSGMNEAMQHKHFEVFACIMDCLARYFWQEGPSENALGIMFDQDTLALPGAVESTEFPLSPTFNQAAPGQQAGRKKDS